MALLIHLRRAEKAIEIGVFTGYSALCSALALSAHGRLLVCDISKNGLGVPAVAETTLYRPIP